MQKKYKACNWAAITVVTDGVGQSDPINIRIMLLMLLGLFLDWKPNKLLFIGVRINSCSVCHSVKNAVRVPDHKCYKIEIFTSQSMKTDIITLGFF